MRMKTVSLPIKSLLLFLNFFLVLAAYYQLKPTSRSLYLEQFGSEKLPYVWLCAASVLGLLMPIYDKAVKKFSRSSIVLCSYLGAAFILIFYWQFLQVRSSLNVVSFYIFVDILSVVLVEQFWSLVNTNYLTSEGKKWYGFIGSGGLFGSIVGGALAAKLIYSYKLKSVDLLIVSSAILTLLSLFSYLANKREFYKEVRQKDNKDALVIQTRWNELLKSRYFWGIFLVLFFSQMIEPLVEYIFLNTIEKEVQGLDERTALISFFFSILGTASLLINIFITPLILKFFGVIGGLIVQPLSIILGSIWFSLQGSLNSALTLKISDRGLSYSINRAAKEILYLPLNPSMIYRTKAWLDMFGYRLFKLASSVLILCFTDWGIFSVGKNDLSCILIAICLFWIATIAVLSREYSKLDKA